MDTTTLPTNKAEALALVIRAWRRYHQLLSGPQSEVIRLRWGVTCPPVSVGEVAKHLKITRGRVMSIESDALARLLAHASVTGIEE